jgi:hypothetical protein
MPGIWRSSKARSGLMAIIAGAFYQYLASKFVETFLD